MNVWIVWNGELAPEDRSIVEVFDNEAVMMEFIAAGGEAERQGYMNLSLDDNVDCHEVCESVAEAHSGYLEVLRECVIRKMTPAEREALGVAWDAENDVEINPVPHSEKVLGQ
jgi:hypothetical protein